MILIGVFLQRQGVGRVFTPSGFAVVRCIVWEIEEKGFITFSLFFQELYCMSCDQVGGVAFFLRWFPVYIPILFYRCIGVGEKVDATPGETGEQVKSMISRGCVCFRTQMPFSDQCSTVIFTFQV